MAFEGFTPELLDFFMGVRLNNSKSYMDAHREEYRRVAREPFLALAAELSQTVARIDPELELRPERAVSRINRDTRFSRDKSPYRDHLWIGFRPPRTPVSQAYGFYFDVTLSGWHYGVGIWGDLRPMMGAFREKAALLPDTLRQIMADPALSGYEVYGDSYKKDMSPSVPQDLKKWTNRKNIGLEWSAPLGEELFTPELARTVTQGYESMAEFYHFLIGR